MKFVSYWHDTSQPFTGAQSGQVQGDYEVAVVGGGFTGLNAARKLARSGVKVALLEAHHVAYGASGRNGGHMNSGMSSSYDTAAQTFGPERARMLWQSYDRSIDMIEEIVEIEKIDCSFRRSGKLKLASKASHVSRLRTMGESIRTNVDPSVRWLDREELRSEIVSDEFHGGILYPKSAMAHMGDYAAGLATAAVRHGAEVWENAVVTARKQTANGWELSTPKGSLTARQVILATDAYTTPNFSFLRRRIIPVASFIIATRPLDKAEAAQLLPANRTYVNSLNIANYFRLTPDNRMLFGGRAKFSSDSNPTTDKNSGELLRKQMLRMFPQLASVEIDYCWGGLVGCSRDLFPRAGRADNMIYAGGYSGHGAQMSTLIGSALADMAMGSDETNPLNGLRWDAVPFFSGKPWFMPILGSYYRLKDWLP
jgi:glycine/D-amino acid oxidase-like deaminating enzyme